MKMIVAGSRTIDKYRAFYEVSKYCLFTRPELDFEEFVTGCCRRGPDQVPFLFQDLGSTTPIKEFPADWGSHGSAAGPIRNAAMADYADALLLIWDGRSKGSANMKREMERRGKPVWELVVK